MLAARSLDQSPGLYEISDDDYFKLPYTSKSSLDLIARSPAHYRHWKSHERPKSRAMELGSAAHFGILQPELFAEKYALAPDVDRRTTKGKEAYQEWLAQNGAKTPLPRDDWDTVMGMIDSVQKHPVASWLMRHGKAEQAVVWESGILPCKGKLDFLADQMIIELKTTDCAQKDAFAKSIATYRYYVQAAMYLDGLAAAAPAFAAKSFVFVAVEKSPPFPIGIYVADHKMIEAGRAAYRQDLWTLKECLLSDSWPGYPAEFQEISLPTWFKGVA